MLDTGATISAVRRDLVQHLALTPSSVKYVALADNGRANPLGEVAVIVEWKGGEETVKFIVLENLHRPLILGTDWVKATGAVVYYNRGRILAHRRDSEEFQNFVDGRSVRQEEEVLVIAKPVVVPACSLVFARMKPEKSNGVQQHRVIHANHSEKPKRGWVVPSCVVTEDGGEYLVPILNPTFQAARFYPGEQIVTSERISKEEVNELVVVDEGGDEEGVKSSADETLEETPEIVQKLLDPVPTERKKDTRRLLMRFRHLFFDEGQGPLMPTNLYEHHIETESAEPVRCSPFRVSSSERKLIADEVSRMGELKVIKPSMSPYATNVVIKMKPDGTPRFCLDYRALNRVTVRDNYPLPRPDDILARLGGATVFTELDLKCGYWQQPLDAESQPKTAFVTPDGLYECTRLPFGLRNGGASFQRLMDVALGGLKWTACLVYLDNLTVIGKDFAEHQKRLEAVLLALEKAKLTLNAKKCVFAANEISCLGHRISATGAVPNPNGVRAISEFPSPNDQPVAKRVKALRSFLGMVSFFRRYIHHFSETAVPLYNLLKKKVSWKWGAEQQASFESLKTSLLDAPSLVHFDENGEYELHTDASSVGLGAALMLKKGDDLFPIEFISRRLSDAEVNYHANDLECLAIHWALMRLRHFLFGRKFTVKTDSNVVRWLCQKKELKGKFARWILDMQDFDFQVQHQKGIENNVADALSRFPVHCDVCQSSTLCALRPSGYSNEELALWQQGDESVRTPLLRLQELLTGDEDEDQSDKAFRLSKGVLYKINLSGRGRENLLVVPSFLRRDIIEACHSSPTGGHFGREKTYAKAVERYWWPGLRASIAAYVDACSFCQFHKRPTGLMEGELCPIEPPRECLRQYGIDHIGPFKKTARGNLYMIIAIDLFSKFVIGTPVSHETSAIAVRFLLRDVIAHHGHPDRILTDPGSCFTSGEWAEAMQRFGIKHHVIPGGYPQANGQVERVNRSVVMAVKAFVSENQRNWDERLPEAVIAINTARQSSTQRSPFEVIYGRIDKLPHESLFPWPREENVSNHGFIKRLRELRDTVRSTLLAKQKKMKVATDKKRKKAHIYSPGDLVLVSRNIARVGRTKKLLPLYIGPYQVVGRRSMVTYLVEDIPAMRKRKVWRRFTAHVSQMKRFRTPHDTEWDRDQQRKSAGDAKDRVRHLNRARKKCTDKL